jgi:IS605 OrfB family transposase
MSVKALQAKVVCDTPAQWQALWHTHCIFNEGVRRVLPFVFQMKRGDLGAEYQSIYESIRNNQDGKGKLEALSSLKWKTGKTKSEKEKDKWAALAAAKIAKGELLFDREKLLPNLPSEFRRKIFEMVIQLVSGHEELTKLWEKEHKEWLAEKAAWETEHADYLRVRPVFDEFERAGNVTVKGSRRRWLRYLDFLSTRPDLARWRDPAATVNPLTDEDRKGLRKPAQHFAKFWEKNPELSALDKLHGEYQEKFARPWVEKKNPDGFKLRPTFTLPSPDNHPAWYSFKRDASYYHLDIEQGTVLLKVVPPGEGKKSTKESRVAYRFLPDPRLHRFIDAGGEQKVGRSKYSLFYCDPLIRKKRWAEIRGVKLIFKGKQPYFVFSCDIADEPYITFWQPVEGDTSAKPKKRKVLPEGLVTLAVDFGQKHLGAVTVCRNVGDAPEQIPFRPAYFDARPDGKPVKAWLAELPGLSFADLRAHESELSAGMSLMFGNPQSRRSGGRKKAQGRHSTHGEETFSHLREHLLKMKEDRYKKAAHTLLETALHCGAKVIIIESLQNYRPALARDTRENRNRMTWAVRRIAEFLEMEAKPYGIMVFQAPAFGTSRFCSACGFVGERCSLPSQAEWPKFYAPKFGAIRRYVVQRGGDFFCCTNPQCPRPSRMVNADVNASLNLQKRFYEKFQPVKIADWKPVRRKVQAHIDSLAGIVAPTEPEDEIPFEWPTANPSPASPVA